MDLIFADPMVIEPIWQMLPGGPSAEYNGEVWQYMGTVDYHNGTFVHEFRHRWHPETDERMYAKYQESDIGVKRIV